MNYKENIWEIKIRIDENQSEISTNTIGTLFVQSQKLALCDHAENGLSDMIKLPRSYDRITMVI